MGIFTYDAVTIIQDLITNKWKDIRPPRISAIWDKRSVGFMDDRRDELVIYPKMKLLITLVLEVRRFGMINY